jgi:hypothetical protein
MRLREQRSRRAVGRGREARQRLVADDATRRQGDDGLEHGLDRLRLEQCFDLLSLTLGPGGAHMLGVEPPGPPLARALGPVEGSVRELAQRRAVVRIPRIGGHAGGAGELEAMYRDGCDRRSRALRDRERGLRGGVRQDQRELLAADPCRRVRAAHDAAQLRPHAAQDLVAVRVTVRVVDHLEVVEVQDHERQRLTLAAGVIQRRGQRLVKPAMVDEPGQCVGRGEPSQPVLVATCDHEERDAQKKPRSAEDEQRAREPCDERERDYGDP